MVPLSWAMAKTLEYKPSDPIHFMGYKLLQWIFSNVPKTKKDNIQELIALSTIEMDRKLVVSIIYNNFQCFILLGIISTVYI